MFAAFLPVAYIVLLIGGIYFMISSIMNAFRAYAEILPGRSGMANFVPFLVLIVRGFLTPAGDVYRLKFAKNLMAVAGCWGSAALVKLYWSGA